MNAKRILGLVIVVSLVFTVLTVPKLANADSNTRYGYIKCGDPTTDGTVKIKICNTDGFGGIDTIQVSVPISASDNANQKAEKIADAIEAMGPSCYTAFSIDNVVHLSMFYTNTKFTEINIQEDTTREIVGAKFNTNYTVTGSFSVSGTPQSGFVNLTIPPVFVSTDTTNKTAKQIMQDLHEQLMEAGVSAYLDNELIIKDNLANVFFTVDNTDPGLTISLRIAITEGFGGTEEPINKLELLTPSIISALMILLTIVLTVIYFKRRKK